MLNLEDVEEYRRNGFLRVKNLLSQYSVVKIRNEILTILQSPPAGLRITREELAPYPVRKIRNICGASRRIKEICLNPILISTAEALLGGPVNFCGDQVLFKVARFGSAKPLHQDAAYFRSSPPDAIVTFWCALHKADEENGCMHYVCASHQNGIVDHQDPDNSPHLIAKYPRVVLVPVQASPGDVIAHSSLTLHSTPANKSHHDRWAILLHFIHVDAEFPPSSSVVASVERVFSI